MDLRELWWAAELSALARRRIRHELRRRGLRIAESAAFALAKWRDEGRTHIALTELACLSGYENPSYWGRQLERAGLVRRETCEDRRIVLLTMTDAGRELAEALIADLRTWHAPVRRPRAVRETAP